MHFLKATCFGEIDTEAVPPPLILAGHFDTRMAKLFLHVAFVDLGRGGQPGTQRMAGKHNPAVAFRQVAAYTGRQRSTLDEAGNLLVV